MANTLQQQPEAIKLL